MHCHFVRCKNADAVVDLRCLVEIGPSLTYRDAVNCDCHLMYIDPTSGIVINKVPWQVFRRMRKEEGIENTFGIMLTGRCETGIPTFTVQQELGRGILLEDVEGAKNIGGLDVRVTKLGYVVV